MEYGRHRLNRPFDRRQFTKYWTHFVPNTLNGTWNYEKWHNKIRYWSFDRVWPWFISGTRNLSNVFWESNFSKRTQKLILKLKLKIEKWNFFQVHALSVQLSLRVLSQIQTGQKVSAQSFPSQRILIPMRSLENGKCKFQIEKDFSI